MPIVRLSPVMILRLSFNEACVLSRMPIVWACFVVACFSWVPKAVVVCCMASDVNWDTLSVMIVVGR